MTNRERLTLNLTEQMSFERMRADAVRERVFSSYIGRLYATVMGPEVVLTAISWDRVQRCETVADGIEFLLTEHARYRALHKKPE